MKKLCLILIVFSLFVFAGCGNSKKENKNETPDSEETVTDDDVTDSDAANSDSPDSSDTGVTDNDITDSNSDSDTETPDSEETVTDDDADYQPDNDDDPIDKLKKECEKAGGYIYEETAPCRKDLDCDEKPENSEWNGHSWYYIEYTDGKWSDEKVATEHNETEGNCHFVCNNAFYWDGQRCRHVCDPNPCINVINSKNCLPSDDGKSNRCECMTGYDWKAETSTCEDSCDEGLYWNSSLEECMTDPCLSANCGEHSDGSCIALFNGKYRCGCEEGYFWDTYEAKCQTNPCLNVNCSEYEHSDGNYCEPLHEDTYSCNCELQYFWDYDKKNCLPSPCLDIDESVENFNGGCYIVDENTCECNCKEGYFWDSSEKKCFTDPCINVDCSEVEHSYGNCIPLTESTYKCGCHTSYNWNAATMKCEP